MRKKQGQAAMEFLMTYGWAILIVVIGITALTYFGVLNPSRFLPESCTLVAGLSCVDFKVTTTEIVLVVQNGMGDGLYDLDISVGDCQLECEGCLNSIYNGEKTTWRNYCSQNLGKFKAQVYINYKKGESPITRNKKGEIITKVKMGDFYNFEDSCGLKNGYYTNSTDFGDSAIPYCWFEGARNSSCNSACSNEGLICANENNNWNDNCDIINYIVDDIQCWTSSQEFAPATYPHIESGISIGGLIRSDGISTSCSIESIANLKRVCPCVVNN